jgi:hypothetical protein
MLRPRSSAERARLATYPNRSMQRGAAAVVASVVADALNPLEVSRSCH